MEYAAVMVEGIKVAVPCIEISGRAVVVSGRWLKIASVKDEDWHDGEVVAAPDEFISTLQQHRELAADLFTFSQKLKDATPRFAYPYELQSVAAIPVKSFDDWWKNRVSSDLRKDVRRAAKRGVVVRSVPFTDEFVHAIVDIYNETPIRQGRPFWHYNKSFEAVKQANATYMERAEFLGAFLGDELIGFLKIVYVDHLARLMQIISKEAHRDKRPMNALIAKAVELCDKKGCSHLTYGAYVYSHGADSVTAFKHRNGFQEILVPRYYVPLTVKGRLALHFHLHRGLKALVPGPVRQALKRVRLYIYQARLRREAS